MLDICVKYQISSWGSQLITVTYKQMKGLRKRHQRPEGYSIRISKVVLVSINILYGFWNDDGKRDKWVVQSGFGIQGRNINNNLHLVWVDGKTSIDVNLYRKGQDKSQDVVQHNRLSSLAEIEKMKYYRKAKLERLSAYYDTFFAASLIAVCSSI